MTTGDYQEIIDIVNGIFINTDERKWDEFSSLFSDRVLLDYTSMTSGTPSSLTLSQIVDSWKGILPGFKATHHQISNYRIEVKGSQADAFCYGTATHFLPNDKGSPLWTVVGTYDFHLTKSGKVWRVDKMKFNLKYQDGNTGLPALAQENLGSKRSN